MTTAIIQKLRSGGAVFELGPMDHWFASWRDAVAEAQSRGMNHVVLEPQDQDQPVLVLVSTA